MASDENPPVIEGPGKGKAYFDRARTVADTGNYDYAIDMFIEGLLREPLNMKEHETLRDVALRRKVKGGKAAGGIFGVKAYFKGKSPKEQMLNAEWVLAKDPGNISAMLTLLRQAAAAGYREVIQWFGPFVLQANRTQKKPDSKIYVELADIYEGIEEFAKASEAVQLAQQMAPTDAELDARIKELAARETLTKGKYETVQDFKESLLDKEKTKDLLQKESLSKTDEFKLKMIAEARVAYEQNPTEHQNVAKLVKALIDIETDEYENEAAEVLQKAYEQTSTYRYKMMMGDVRIKQFRRRTRIAREQAKAHPEDQALKQNYHDLEAEQLKFELQEYTERVEHLPSDMTVQYEYGRRLYMSKRFDEAIGALQQAQNSPRFRSDALYFLGRCFLEQSMNHEAAETLQRAIESYELAETGDQKSKEMHYWLARAYEAVNKPADAEKTYSRVTQWDIGFRDARQRLSELRKLR
ncbi:MAG TPA: tetratricopeptide repeat protein [Phycisphaerae bacterium]|nr:tetratricopeptide repeat protein [Phycisphaerae bacterium]